MKYYAQGVLAVFLLYFIFLILPITIGWLLFTITKPVLPTLVGTYLLIRLLRD